jgi:nitrate/nitrite transporter NarK
MGAASGLINTAGQLAAFVSPILVGFLVGMTKGSFAATFIFFIVSLLVSAAVVLSMGRRSQPD